jgi:hypothetical protein
VRTFLWALLVGGLVLGGCASHQGSSVSFSEATKAQRPSVSNPGEKLIITPDNLLVGKIARVNAEGGFVVLTFPISHLPTLEQRRSVYRHGLKIGEVRVTGPQLDDSVVGDLVAGEAQPGDEVRAQ